MSPVGFEPTISAGERRQTYALDLAANGTETLGGTNTKWRTCRIPRIHTLDNDILRHFYQHKEYLMTYL